MKECLLRVTIDGFSGCCKSLLGKTLSDKFGLVYIGTGLIYRFVTLQLITKQISPAAVTKEDLLFLNEMTLMSDGTILWRGTKYSDNDLQSDMLQNQVSVYAQNQLIRQHITCWIRSFANNQSVVMDGRDAGTQILPNAEIKVFITSSIEHRVNNWRRIQLERFGHVDPVLLAQYAEQLAKRDYDDLNRSISPLRCPPDAMCFQSDVDGYHNILDAVSSRIQQHKTGQR